MANKDTNESTLRSKLLPLATFQQLMHSAPAAICRSKDVNAVEESTNNTGVLK